MSWVSTVVRGGTSRWSVPDVGPLQDAASCLRAMLQTLERHGFKASLTAEHDQGWGHLIEGVGAGGDTLTAIAWQTDHISQGCLEIYFQRLGLLPRLVPRGGCAKQRFRISGG